jgi:hypothetical protein
VGSGSWLEAIRQRRPCSLIAIPQTERLSMKHKFDDIENAFEYVSSAPPCENQAIVSLDTGEIYYVSDMGDSDELPDDYETSDRYIGVPHKNDLDMGVDLVRSFAAERLPDEYDKVESIFQRRGAYARFKDLLQSKDLLEEWYAYEAAQSQAALRAWCEVKGLELAD